MKAAHAPSYGEKRKKMIWICMMVVGLLLLSLCTATLARYVLQWQDARAAVPANFCFTSDYLQAGEEPPEYTVYTGSTVDITLKNNDGVNITTQQIVYTVIATSGGSLSKPTGTIDGGTADADTITLTGSVGNSYMVTASATAPYAQTLAAVFTFEDAGAATVYSVTDHGTYLTLDIYTGNTGDSITICYGNGLAADNTDTRMADWTGNQGTLSDLAPNAHYELIFFENIAASYGSGQQVLNGNEIIIAS